MATSGDREAVIVVDLGFGDAGKGTVTDWLARTRGAHTVVRFNGGAQARHNVITPGGRHHCFSQFGSGTLAGAATHLSRHMLVSPLAMMVEAKYLHGIGAAGVWNRTTIDRDALVITPFHRAANRLREMARGDGRHGSCGIGIGETASDAKHMPEIAVRVGDLRLRTAELRKKLTLVRAFNEVKLFYDLARCKELGVGLEEARWFTDESLLDAYLRELRPFLAKARIVDGAHLDGVLRRRGSVVFEGAQGVLLDEARGFHPYTTWSNCTFDNALALLGDHGYDGRVEKLGVVRAYQTRHGPGPFVTEDRELTAKLPDPHNGMDDWQRGFRVGWFDAVATRYAIAACGGVDGLAVTCFDRLRGMPDWHGASTTYVIHPTRESADDERVFVLEDGRRDLVRDIRLGPRGDLDHQALLTAALAKVSPWGGSATTSTDFDVQVEDHIASIERETRTKVRVASFGPTAKDKRLRG